MSRRLAILSAGLLLAASNFPMLAQSGARASTSAPVAAPNPNGFDQWADGMLKEWNIPGMAVGAIKGGKVVLLKGYGYRNLEDRQPVTPQTLMAIGSNSKSFTVVLLSQLVDEGKLDWDKPVTDYLPDFQLKDDYATKNFRVKDLVTHISGLPRHDALWYGRTNNRKDVFQHLKYLDPSTSFRGRWQYNNLMFITAGLLVEQLRGQPWDQVVRERIFKPLEMTRTNTSTNDMPASGDFSYPYLLFGGKIGRVPFRNIDNAGPAGSINSSVEEMLHYVQMHLNMGEWNGKRILSAKNDLKMQSPQSVVTERMADPELGPETYGLATWVSSYRGHKWVQHGGGIDGFISQMAWLPNDSIGVVVLTNMSGPANPVPNVVVKRVFDDLLGLPPVDWNARARKDAERAKNAADSTTRIPLPPPPATALTINGKPTAPAARAISSSLAVAGSGASLPGTTGTPTATAAVRAAVLLPIRSIASADGPMNVSPAPSHALANAAFSARKPYPGCTASAPDCSITSSSLSTFR